MPHNAVETSAGKEVNAIHLRVPVCARMRDAREFTAPGAVVRYWPLFEHPSRSSPGYSAEGSGDGSLSSPRCR